MQKHGPWTILTSAQIYQDPWMDVRCDQVLRPDGSPGTFSTIRIKAGVCVIAVDSQDQIYLTREFHYAVGRVTIEGASGGIEPGETDLQSAQRELSEELGITAKRWTKLGYVDPFTSALQSPTQLYLAEDLSFQAPQTEATEIIECVKMPFDEAVRMVIDSQITHAPTCSAILKAALLKRQEQR
jgi:ADP-ribose pyrophosphatase